MRTLVPWAALLGGCVATADLPGDVALPSELCVDSIAPGAVVEVAGGFTDGTTGIAFSPQGRLFVTHGEVVEEVGPDGARSAVAQVPAAAGLEWWSGGLAVVSSDAGFDDGAGAVYLLDPDGGEPAIFVRPLPGAEAATITPWRSLAVASPTADEEVVEVQTNGGLDGFVQEVPAPFGVGFSLDGGDAWVSSQRADAPTLWRFPIVDDNITRGDPFFAWDAPVAPGEVVVSTTDDAVYVALTAAGRLARIDPVTGAEEDIGFGLDAPLGMALGTGSWDPCALYVTSPSSASVFAVGVSR